MSARVASNQVTVELVVFAETAAALRRMQELIAAQWTTDSITIPPQVFLGGKFPIAHLFTFSLRPDLDATLSP